MLPVLHSQQAWNAQVLARVPVHKLTYDPVREADQLTAQMAVRCIGKVVDGYKLDQKAQRQFKPHGAIAYDDRILNWRVANQQVSIWMLNRRETVNFTCGEHHLALLHYQQGETDLVYRKGKFYLYTTCNVPDDTPLDPEGWIGADLGITNLLTDSDGEIYSARHLLNVRHRYRRLRKKLQKKGTKSAKRLGLSFGTRAAICGSGEPCISQRWVEGESHQLAGSGWKT
jgi:hypothetical protein